MEINQQKQVRHLLVIGGTAGFSLVPLEASSHSIGRDPTNSIVLASKAVSRQHALLLRVTSADASSFGFLLIDGDLQGKRSTNGIKINGKKQFSRRLKGGDCILFGNQVKARYLNLQPLSDAEFELYCQDIDYEELLAEENFVFSPTTGDSLEQESFDEASLIRLASFPEIIPSPMFEVNLQGELTYLNPAAASTFPELPVERIEHPVLQGLLELISASEQNILVREVEVAGKAYEQSIHYISESDLVRCCVFDITERKHAEAELRKRDRLLQSVAQATTHLLESTGYDLAIFKALEILGKASGVDRISICENHPLTQTNEVVTSMRFEWTRDSIESIRHKAHRQGLSYRNPTLAHWHQTFQAAEAVCSLTQELSDAERTLLLRDGILSILVVPIFINSELWGFIELDNCTVEYRWSPQEESVVFAMAASISAALQRQDKEEIIRHQAFHDALTDLPNRVLFNDRLKLALAGAQRTKQDIAVMFLDLDRFKVINDSLGHSMGDELLLEVANRLRACLREGDTVARWGGDEFTLLLPQAQSIDDVTLTAYRILESLKLPFMIREHELHVTASIGISISAGANDSAETLMQSADVALYRSKEHGRGTYQIYSPAMNSKAPDLLALENGLRYAIERDELLLCYQPKINIQTGAIMGLEALIRWQHPERGLVSPATFIPLAEETGLIIEIGEWVLRTACQQTVEWHRQGLQPLSVAVNLSARQFFQPNLPEIVAQVLLQTQLDPQALELEVTETTAVKNMDFTKSVLAQLKDIGVHIAMDDFGTGYSSLNYLKELPFNTLKIDQSFIRDLKPRSKDVEIINAVLGLGRGLKLDIVAEGVDSEEQLSVLQSLECEIVQGYLFSRPLPADEITKQLEANWLDRKNRNLINRRFKTSPSAS
ncbi:MAG: EAL domain-containing protein [Cyanobacteria bacterium P01_A01_bin.17]